MKTLETLCDGMISGREAIRNAFRWDSEQFYPVCANLFLINGTEPDGEKLRACLAMVKDRTNVFSDFRGNARLPVICLLSLEEDPEKRLEKVLSAHKALRSRFMASDYLALAAWTLSDLDEDSLDQTADRARALYGRMRKEHPLLTGSEDTVFTALLALSDRDDDALIRDTEASYALLKTRFLSGDSMQTVSHILALDPRSPGEKTAKLTELYDAVVQNGIKYGRTRELALLAPLALTDADSGVIAREMLTVYDRLENVKGWTGIFGYDRRQRAMHAAMLVSDLHDPAAGRANMMIAQQTTLNAVIAQQMAVCAAVTASAAASSAASSSH